MRLWSIHPQYLDHLGLIACWREGLLALSVLSGQTDAYKNHPQLIRFKQTDDPVNYLRVYLQNIAEHALIRGYNFNQLKITNNDSEIIDMMFKIKKFKTMDINNQQIQYEFLHLQQKLFYRDRLKFKNNKVNSLIFVNPMFHVIDGPIEKWERVRTITIPKEEINVFV